MKYTSAEAAKLLRKLNEERDLLCAEEQESKEFVAAIQEDLETARPFYDFAATQQKIEELNGKIRKVKHAVNVFNTTHSVEGFGMTVDEMLVYLPQLKAEKEKLTEMARRLEKQRVNANYNRNGAVIEYSYANYDIKEARKRLDEISSLLAQAQTALDRTNSLDTMEIEL